MIVGIGPILIALGGGLFLREGLTRWLVIGTAVAFAGVAADRHLERCHGCPPRLGVLAAAVAGRLTYAAGVLFQKPMLRRLPVSRGHPHRRSRGSGRLPAVRRPAGLRRLDGAARIDLGVVYLGVVPTAIAFTTWGYALSRMPAGQLGVTTYLVPPLVILAGLVVFQEVPDRSGDHRRRALPGRRRPLAPPPIPSGTQECSMSRPHDSGRYGRFSPEFGRMFPNFGGRPVPSASRGLSQWLVGPAASDPLIRCPAPSRASAECAPTLAATGSPHIKVNTQENCGCQDPSQAPGQDPCAVLPHRRRRLAHQARRSRDRGDRQVPPHRGALVHRGRLRARAVLARRRRAADRAGRRDAEAHGRLGQVQGRRGRGQHRPGQGAEGRLRGRREEEARRSSPRREKPKAAPLPRRPRAEAEAADEHATEADNPDVLAAALEHLVKGIVDHPDDVQVDRTTSTARRASSRCACTPTTSAA